ncbi:hypothetical protein RISK_002230 [Rhodopirellula islandica]|uniref:Uncharacterized protein n=1 Tax=Rhodopirellula islandica TaxID=595434 RepID=A0A0J1BGD7_RHOIS|nr:hypothetical protein RISK_002230 [Rhodopirellula islandica]
MHSRRTRASQTECKTNPFETVGSGRRELEIGETGPTDHPFKSICSESASTFNRRGLGCSVEEDRLSLHPMDVRAAWQSKECDFSLRHPRQGSLPGWVLERS